MGLLFLTGFLLLRINTNGIIKINARIRIQFPVKTTSVNLPPTVADTYWKSVLNILEYNPVSSNVATTIKRNIFIVFIIISF